MKKIRDFQETVLRAKLRILAFLELTLTVETRVTIQERGSSDVEGWTELSLFRPFFVEAYISDASTIYLQGILDTFCIPTVRISHRKVRKMGALESLSQFILRASASFAKASKTLAWQG